MVGVIPFCSRVIHLLTAGLMLSACIIPLLYSLKGEPAFAWVRLITPIGAGVSLLTGLYNAGAVQPSKMQGRAGLWRLAVYGLKGFLLVACTPLLDRALASAGLTDKPTIDLTRLACVVLMFVVASWSRYYREEHSQAITGKQK